MPSGSWRAKVYAGKDPLTGREIRFGKSRKTEVEAQIELGKLLALARAGRQPDSEVTVAELLDEYVPVAGWDVSTTETNLGYIRRTIKPALGIKEVRKVRGLLLDNLCTRLQQCGKPFTEHRHVPDLRPDPSDPRTDWQQVAGRLRKPSAAASSPPATRCRRYPTLPGSTGTVRHAFLELASEGLLVIRHGPMTQVAGDPLQAAEPAARYRLAKSRPGHDWKLSGCRPHVCKPMSRSTIHAIHSILSGAFEAAQRWEWVDFNRAESAKPPTVIQKKKASVSPSAVVEVIGQACAGGQDATALCLARRDHRRAPRRAVRRAGPGY